MKQNKYEQTVEQAIDSGSAQQQRQQRAPQRRAAIATTETT